MSAKFNKALEGLVPYKAGPAMSDIRRRYGLDRVAELGANECADGPFPEVVEALTASLSVLNRYPSGDCDELRISLSDRLGVAPGAMMFGNGSCDLLMLLGEAVLGPGTHMVYADPSFVVYESIALVRQAEFDAVPLRDHRHDLDAMKRAVREDTRLLIVCEPNNPSGTCVGPAALRDLMAAVPSETLVVFDEAYTEYATRPDLEDTVPWLQDYENLVILRTFSKIYGLAGLRIGYGVAHPSVIDAIDKVRQPYNVSTLAQVAALEALRHPERVAERRDHVAGERVRIGEMLTALRRPWVPSEANFMLVGVEGLPTAAAEVPNALLERGVLVRSGWGIGYPGWVRATVGTNEENDLFLSALSDLVGEEGST